MSDVRILVVDDEKEYCDILSRYLSERNYSVDVAYDGIAAKELLGYNVYDFVLFDFNMPGLSGSELIKVVADKNPKAKKVMISGYGDINKDLALAAGADVFLSKPIALEDINKIVK